MALSDTQFCHFLQNNKSCSFNEVCQVLYSAAQVSQLEDRPFVISVGTQYVLYHKLLDLLPGFSRERELKNPLWLSFVNGMTLSQWVVGLTHCAEGVYRKKLLKDTSILIKQINYPLTLQEISDMLNSLRTVSDPGEIKGILLACKSHINTALEKGHCFTVKNIIQVFCGLQNLFYSADAKSILALLCTHLAVRIEVSELDPVEIASLLFNLQNWPDILEVRKILSLLQFQMMAQAEAGRWMSNEDLTQAFCGLKNKQNSVEVDEILKWLAANLIINANAKEQLEPFQLSHIMPSLQEMQYNEAVKIALVVLRGQIIANANRERWFTLQEMSIAIDSLQSLPDVTDVKAILTAFIVHIDVREARQEYFALSEIAQMVHGLQSMYVNQEVTCLLSKVNVHLAWHTKIGNWLTPTEIMSIFCGIQNMCQAQEAQDLLLALQTHISQANFSVEAQPHSWLALMLYHLRYYCHQQDSMPRAMQCIYLAAKKLYLSFNRALLEHATNWTELIMMVGRYISHKATTGMELDVRECSLSLATTLCQYIVDDEVCVSETWTIIFGHTTHLAMKMRLMLGSLLIGSRVCHWSDSRVTVEPITVFPRRQLKRSLTQLSKETDKENINMHLHNKKVKRCALQNK